MAMNFNKTISIVNKGIEDKLFPCAAFAVGDKNGVFIKKYIGNKSIFPKESPLDENTLFDMASITKIISTTMVALKAIESGKLCLNDTVDMFFRHSFDKGDISVKELMTHTSGLAPHIPLYGMNIFTDEAIDVILKSGYSYAPATKTEYSCLGYILLGRMLEILLKQPLDVLASELVFKPLGMTSTGYKPTSDNVVSTEFDKVTNQYLKGVVHDENARFLHEVAGNAGVFSTLDDMIKFCTMLSRGGEGYMSKRMFEAAVKDYTPRYDESRGLGFLLATGKPSMAGDLFSKGSFGHTGYTGTSFMVDKDTGVYAILLTNRVHYGREGTSLARFRQIFHNSIWGEL